MKMSNYEEMSDGNDFKFVYTMTKFLGMLTTGFSLIHTN